MDLKEAYQSVNQRFAESSLPVVSISKTEWESMRHVLEAAAKLCGHWGGEKCS